MSLIEHARRIRDGVVAFVPRYPELVPSSPEDLSWFPSIIGTGFIVGDSIIATNGHVINEFNRFQSPPGTPTNELAVSALLFHRFEKRMAVIKLSISNAVSVVKAKYSGVSYGPAVPDIGLVSVPYKGLDKFALQLSSKLSAAGTAVGTIGFPMGTDLLGAPGYIHQITPVLQTGIVSSPLPFDCDIPHGYLLNFMVQGGASGSPVFENESGEVIGVVYASVLDNHPGIDVPFVPTNFSLAVASQFLQRVVLETQDSLRKTLPQKLTPYDEIADDIRNRCAITSSGDGVSFGKTPP